MKKRTVVLVEVALIFGIVFSVFLVPRNLPIRTFLLIAVSIVVAANILLFSRSKETVPVGQYRMGARGYFALGLLVLYWVLHFLWR